MYESILQDRPYNNIMLTYIDCAAGVLFLLVQLKKGGLADLDWTLSFYYIRCKIPNAQFHLASSFCTACRVLTAKGPDMLPW